MKKMIKKIGAFELKLRDEFGIPMYKSKGKPKNIMNDLDCFLKDKGLYNARKPKRKQ